MEVSCKSWICHPIFAVRGASGPRLICNPFVHFLGLFLVIFKMQRGKEVLSLGWCGLETLGRARLAQSQN